MSTRSLLIGILAILAIIVGWWGTYLWNEFGSAPIQATVFEEPRPLNEFSLRDHRDQAFDRQRLQGQWSLVFFGFTNCPGVCPATLAQLSQVSDTLSPEPAIVFVSVDPARDDLATLAGYVDAFGETVLGVTGESAELDKLAESFYVTYSMSGDGDDYRVEHTTAVFLVNPDGQLAAIFSPPIETRQLAADLRRLL